MSQNVNTIEKSPQIDPLLDTIYKYFGPHLTVLVPLVNDEPVYHDGKLLTFDDLDKLPNQPSASSLDIGIECGFSNRNLVAIWFPDEKHRSEFLSRNLALAGTLLTSSPDGFFVWLRVKGRYPGNHGHPKCAWLAVTLLQIGSRDSKSSYKFDNQGHPVSICFRDIVFHPEVYEPLNQEMEVLEFPREVPDKSGRAVLNDDYVIHQFMRFHEIWFNPVTGYFFQITNGLVQRVHEEEIKHLLHGVLELVRKRNETIKDSEMDKFIEAARESQGLGPLKAVAGKGVRVYVDTGLEHLATLVELLKILAIWRREDKEVPEVDQAKAFTTFLRSQIESAPGQSVAVEEAWEAYEQYCLSEDYPRYSRKEFFDRLGKAVPREFGMRRNNRTVRNGKAKRGFDNLRLKSSIDPDSGTDGMGGTGRNEHLDDQQVLQTA
jgi:hypothetical protein